MFYLTEEQLTHFREILEKQEATIRFKSRLTVPAEPDGCDVTEVDNALGDKVFAELADIEAAKLRISQRQYGLCSDCGCTIAEARLEAYPSAKRCTPCQRLHEQHHQ
ncbi:TraR/DksA family transcriptional regulator [Herbaspirillum sp. NPDC101396]|uniref:TraR/DksA family transcriptional regulator n=1 Tax=Herbaspirillum sp. NPDC101396 TaxID=3364005 RepID=UPI00383A36EB